MHLCWRFLCHYKQHSSSFPHCCAEQLVVLTFIPFPFKEGDMVKECTRSLLVLLFIYFLSWFRLLSQISWKLSFTYVTVLNCFWGKLLKSDKEGWMCVLATWKVLGRKRKGLKRKLNTCFWNYYTLEKRICRYFRKAFVASIPFSNFIGFDIPQFRMI